MADLIFVSFDDFKLKAVKNEFLPDFRKGSGHIQEVSGDGDRIFISDLPIEFAVDVPNGNLSVYDKGIVGNFANSHGVQVLNVAFVVDVSDDFLKDIL